MSLTDAAKRLTIATIAAGSLAAGYEGLRQDPYLDPRPNDAILTVCYGHTGSDIQKGKRYTVEECKQLLDEDMRNAVVSVDKCHSDLPFSVLVAFSDAAYNIGPRVACNSQASKYLSQGRYADACNELLKWNRSNGQVLPGLTKRREAEREVCLDFQK
jgi:lysozyme